MVIVPVPGADLNVYDEGVGPAIVLLHGFPHTWRIWAAVIDDLVRDHRVVAPDLRGFGGSSRTPDQMDADTVSRDIEALLEVRGLGPVVLVGIDAGVPPAFLLSVRRPELIGHTVLIESTLGSLPGAAGFFAGGPPWWF